jgi:hypothetical protein
VGLHASPDRVAGCHVILLDLHVVRREELSGQGTVGSGGRVVEDHALTLSPTQHAFEQAHHASSKGRPLAAHSASPPE